MSRIKLRLEGHKRTSASRVALNSLGLLIFLAIVWGVLWDDDEQGILEAPRQEEAFEATTGKPFPEKTSETQQEPAVAAAGAEDEPGDIGAQKALTEDLLVLGTSSRTWAEVYSADGERLLFGMLTSEETPVRMRGLAPFRILLGNSPDVTVEVNGETIDQSRFNRSNNTAHFLVDATGTHHIPVASSDR
jgi:hypothetical protein